MSIIAELSTAQAKVRRLEAEVERLRVHSERQSGTIRDLIKRAEAAEAEVERLRDIISPGDAAAYEESMAALQAEVERLRAECARHKRNAECYACEAGDPDMDGVQDTKLSRAEAEVARLREELGSTRDEVRRVAVSAQAEVERLRAALRHDRRVVEERRMVYSNRRPHVVPSTAAEDACSDILARLAPEVK